MKQVFLFPFLLGLLGCLFLAHAPLVERAKFDAHNMKALVAVDLDEVATVARAVGRDPGDELARLAEVGVNACVTTTHTLSDLVSLGEVAVEGTRTTRVTVKDPSDPYRVQSFLDRLKIQGAGPLVMEMKAFRDHRLEERARQLNMTPVYRLNNAPWAGPAYIDALCADLPQDALVVFDEKQVLGWPSNTQAALERLKEKKAAVCIVEFAGQVGTREMAAQGGLPTVLLHSIGRPEMAKLNLARILPRWIRAAAERNTRVLVAHYFPATNLPYKDQNVADANVRYLKETVAAIRQAGFELGPPLLRAGHGQPARFQFGRTPAVVGIALAVGLLVAWILVLLDAAPAWLALMLGVPLAAFALGMLVMKPVAGGKLIAMLVGALTPAAATLLVYRGALAGAADATGSRVALESAGRAVAMLAVCLTGGLLLAATLTNELFVYRLEEFMGVKLVYLSGPIAAVVGYVWLHRVNPFSRPVRVRDVALVGAVAVAGLVYILRSGNFISVSATNSAEYAVRDAIEGFVSVRPRTKELLGYPALILLGFAVRWRDRLWTPFLLLGASITAVSAVNSFCHIHSPPLTSVARGAIAILPGLLLGVLAVPVFALLLHVPRRPLVTVSGYLGFGNFGDELILANLRKLVHEVLGERVAFAPFLKSGGLSRTSPAALLTGVRQSIAHVSLGGGVFQDRTGWVSPLYYAVYLVLARLFFVPRVLVMAQSFSIRRTWIAQVVARALAPADLLMTRDESSARLLERWGLHPVVGADLATWYPPAPVTRRPQGRTLGVSLRPPPEAMAPRAAQATLAPVLEALAALAKARGLELVWLSFQADQDRPLLESIAGENRIVDVTVENIESVLSELDLLVATRYHAMLLAFLVELPMFALSYDSKTEDLLDEAACPHRWKLGGDAADLAGRLAAWAADPGDASARAGAVFRARGAAARARAAQALASLSDELSAMESDVVRDPVTISETTAGSSAY